ARDPLRRLSELLPRGADGRTGAVGDRSVVDFPQTSVPELVARRVELTPGAPAVECGAEVLTYAALTDRARAVSGALLARGVSSQGAVGVCMAPSCDLVATALGVLASGAAYLPLDPQNPAGRQLSILREARPAAVIADRAHAAAVAGGGGVVLVA